MLGKDFVKKGMIMYNIVFFFMYTFLVAPNLYKNNHKTLLFILYIFWTLMSVQFILVAYKDPGYIKDLRKYKNIPLGE